MPRLARSRGSKWDVNDAKEKHVDEKKEEEDDDGGDTRYMWIRSVES